MPGTITPYSPLSINEMVQGGYTLKVSIKAADLQALPTATVSSQLFTLFTAPVGTVISDAAILVVTPFTFSDATILTTTLGVGDTASATTYFATKNIAGAAQTTPVLVNTPYAFATPQAYVASSVISATVTVTSTKVLNTCTAGEVLVLLAVRQLAELAYPQQ